MKTITIAGLAGLLTIAAGIVPATASEGSRVDPDSTYYAPGMVPIGPLASGNATPAVKSSAPSAISPVVAELTAAWDQIDSRVRAFLNSGKPVRKGSLSVRIVSELSEESKAGESIEVAWAMRSKGDTGR